MLYVVCVLGGIGRKILVRMLKSRLSACAFMMTHSGLHRHSTSVLIVLMSLFRFDHVAQIVDVDDHGVVPVVSVIYQPVISGGVAVDLGAV